MSAPLVRTWRFARIRAGLRSSILMLGLLASTAVLAHDARPLSVTIVPQGSGFFRVLVQVPPTIEAVNAPDIVWPDGCDIRASEPLPAALGRSSLIHCPGDLAGRTISVEYPIYNPSITTLLRLETENGPSRTAVLPPDELTWTVPVEPTAARVARDYAMLGFEHILSGPDHLLFVAGLMLLAGRARRIVMAVTGFTLAHSATLSLAALGFIHAPVALVETLIALSILFVAAEIAHRGSPSLGRRFPTALAFVFGLLHGLGFASALGEVGLPTVELATGLVFFNVGVELGQMAFIAFVLAVFAAWRHWLAAEHIRDSAWARARASLAGAYVLGVPAAFWSIERGVIAFTV